MKTGYRRAAAGVVGCLLVGSALGGTALSHGGPVPVASPTSPSGVSRAFRIWEPTYDDNAANAGQEPAIAETAHLRRQMLKADSPALAVETYTVQDGDSLWSIADAYDTDAGTLQALNADVEPATLQPGQQLKVIKAFHGLTYTVQSGDTLDDVANTYGITADEIWQANGFQLAAGLREGETLFLPGARPHTNMVVSRGDFTRPETPPPAAETKTASVAVAPAKPAPAAAPAAAPPAAPAPAPAAKAAPPAKHADATYIWPLEGPVTSEFGYREDIGDFHEGIDIYAPTGTVAVAARGGTVELSGWSGGYGQCIIINHGDGTKSRYAHASELLVLVGETVKQGEPILKVGSTGHATGPHLHFEVIVDGKPQNPRNYLP